ncbi:hypothetical protein BGW39_011612 [Mortierella sp. 14UC]|nr:hypothetical protein BGW39_011612 [Mortierella sp. 14UC]
MNGPFIRPDLTEGVFSAGVFTVKNTWRRTLAQQELDWLTTQRFWLFLRSINATATTATRTTGLRELSLDHSLDSFFDLVSIEFFCDTLARFKELEFLENDYIPVSLDTLFSILPKLKHFRRLHHLLDDGFPQQPYPQLNILELGAELATRSFYALLRYLPNLDQLRFRGFRFTRSEVTAAGAAELLNHTPSRLTRLWIDGAMSLNSENIQIALQWLPDLTHITFGRIYPNVAFVIGLYCKHVQHICELDGSIRLEILALKHLFEQCRDLQSFVGTGHMVSLNSLAAIATGANTIDIAAVVDYDDDEDWIPWVCDQLTQLRCQIGKLERLTGPEQELYDKISAPRYTARVPKGRHLTVTLKHELSMAQHGRMYEYLARLSCLTVLDVGFEAMVRRRALMAANSTYPNPSIMRIEQYLAEFGPVSGTLALTLESGLGRLATLENLEVFGFEGVDHRMGKAEIEWMARTWPLLKVLRGLQQDYPPRIEYERRKNELRGFMEVLRPDVRHEN